MATAFSSLGVKMASFLVASNIQTATRNAQGANHLILIYWHAQLLKGIIQHYQGFKDNATRKTQKIQ
jgi:hypothetical protein